MDPRSPRGITRLVGGTTPTVRPTLRLVSQSLVIPQGFTLSISGSLAVLIGKRGHPGTLGVWLFVLGAGLGFCVMTALSGVQRDPSARPEPVTGAAVFNLVPLTVIPAVLLGTRPIGDDEIAFAIGGLLAVVVYVAGLAGLIAILGPRGPVADG